MHIWTKNGRIACVVTLCFTVGVSDSGLQAAENRGRSGMQILDLAPEGPVALGENTPANFVAARADAPDSYLAEFATVRKAIDKKLKEKYGEADPKRLKYERFESKAERSTIAMETLKGKSVIRATKLWSYKYEVPNPIFKENLILTAKIWVNTYLEPKAGGDGTIKLAAVKVEAIQDIRDGPVAEVLAKYVNQLQENVFDFKLDPKDFDIKLPEGKTLDKVELEKAGLRISVAGKKES
jgi:hypothetical protein